MGNTVTPTMYWVGVTRACSVESLLTVVETFPPGGAGAAISSTWT
jgi:hypothetical protein